MIRRTRCELSLPYAPEDFDWGVAHPVQVHPLRDVLLSLLANVAAWAIGVFIAYLMHDADPVYMQATRQYERAEREYHRLRRDTEDEKRTITAQHGKRERDLRAAAETKATSVHLQHQVLLQVEKHEAAVIAAVAAQVSTNATTYHDVLAQAVIAKQGECRIRQGDKDISPYEFKLLQPMIGAAELRAMVD